MKKTILFLVCALLVLPSAALAAESRIWGGMLLESILDYGGTGSPGLGPLFVLLQTAYIKKVMLAVLLGVPLIFCCHYLLFGPKRFSHDGEKIYLFTLVQRLIHLLAVISFLLLIPTGVMIIFGKFFGGGTLVIMARYIHGVATVIFALSVIPMFLFWVLEMLPTIDDIKWMLILGGYLSRDIREIPAGKFNAGQKMWFWIATLGGMVMIASGAMMYMQDFDLGIASTLGLSQINLLRLAAIVHNVLAVVITAFFLTHAYMSLFAIKGAIHSMITGYKEEDEVRYLHSSYYKKLRG